MSTIAILRIDEDIEVEVDKTLELLFRTTETLAILEEGFDLFQECYEHTVELFEGYLMEERPFLDMSTVTFVAYLIPPEGFLTIALFKLNT